MMRVVEIDKNICTGCQECTKVCPAYAIEGNPGEPQTINVEKCVMCGQCVQKCKSYVSIVTHGYDAYNKVKKERGIPDCVNEPLFAAHNVTHIGEVKKALADPTKVVMASAAPAVRTGLAEEFGYKLGTLSNGKMAAAFRALGFDFIYDVNFAADLTIMEEGSELIQRVTTGKGKLPMFTSCCPAWVTFMERNYPDLTDHLSSCKSPQQMQGAVQKTFGADVNKLKKKDIFNVSVMPCTCKEYECSREEMNASGERDIDVVITTRELAWLIKDAGIDFKKLPEEDFDSPLGGFTGAAEIFGVTGGVMEAALRTVYFKLTGKESEPIEFKAVRGHDAGIREASLDINGTTVNVAIASGMKSAKVLLDEIREGKSKYQFIEIMGCPGGCINGGGQPYVRECFLPNEDDDIMDTYKEKRAQALYTEDERQTLRQSHNNPQIIELYEKFLGEPNSHKSHELLHTTYAAREGFNEI